MCAQTSRIESFLPFIILHFLFVLLIVIVVEYIRLICYIPVVIRVLNSTLYDGYLDIIMILAIMQLLHHTVG
jgi:hypothetical protein